MKRFIKPTAIVMAMSVMTMAGVSHAGNIQFNGQVTAQTCDSNVNKLTNATVYLDSISYTELNAANATAGLTMFSITLEDCNFAADGTAAFYFQSDLPVLNGNIVNTTPVLSGGAPVDLRLFDDAKVAIPLTSNGLIAAGTQAIEAGVGGIRKDYYVGYANTKPSALLATDVGPVTGAVNYVVRYQ